MLLALLLNVLFSSVEYYENVSVIYFEDGYYFDVNLEAFGELLCMAKDDKVVCVPMSNYRGDVSLLPADTE